MSVFTLPSAHGRHLNDRAFKRSFIVSMAIHILVIAAAGGMTLFRMTGITYAPTYTVDLVTLPPSPKTTGSVKAAPAQPKPQPVKPVPKPPEKKVPVKEVARPAEPKKEIQPVKPSGGDEAAQVKRRQQIEELELEARRLYEKFTADYGGSRETVSDDSVRDQEEGSESVTGTGPARPEGGKGRSADLRFRAYYDQIWGKIRSSWVLPAGVATEGRLLTVVGIRISPSGEIEQYWIEKKSGNEYYDQSAIRAIRKSDPLPSLPKDLANEPLEVGVNFRYPE